MISNDVFLLITLDPMEEKNQELIKLCYDRIMCLEKLTENDNDRIVIAKLIVIEIIYYQQENILHEKSMEILQRSTVFKPAFWLRKAIRLRDESYCLQIDSTVEQNISFRANIFFTSAEAYFLKHFREFNPYDDEIIQKLIEPICMMMDYASELDSCFFYERLTYYLLSVALYAVDEYFIDHLKIWIHVLKKRNPCNSIITNLIAELSCEIAFMKGSPALYFIYSKQLIFENRRNVAKYRAMQSFRTFDSYKTKLGSMGSLSEYDWRLPLRMEHSRHFALKKDRVLHVEKVES